LIIDEFELGPKLLYGTPCLRKNCTNCFCQTFVKFPSIL